MSLVRWKPYFIAISYTSKKIAIGPEVCRPSDTRAENLVKDYHRKLQAYHANLLTWWPEVGGEGRAKRVPRPAAPPSAAPSGPGPKFAARGVESVGGEKRSSRCSSCAAPVGPAASRPGGKRRESAFRRSSPSSQASTCFLGG